MSSAEHIRIGLAERSIPCEVTPFRLSGTVYVALLNHRSALAELGDAVVRPPYQAPPRAPVLYLKPRNTLLAPGGVVRVPADTPELEVGASVAAVIGRTASHVPADRALEYVTGYLLLADVGVPVPNHFRPSVRLKARDGFCPMGPAVIPARQVDPGAVTVRVWIDGHRVQVASTAELLRPAAQLIADVTEFMTLAAGDVIALGAAAPAPRVRPGQTLRIEAGSLGSLSQRFERETP